MLCVTTTRPPLLTKAYLLTNGFSHLINVAISLKRCSLEKTLQTPPVSSSVSLVTLYLGNSRTT
jgi:hypothetical protein